MVLLYRLFPHEVYFFKSLTNLKFQKYSVGQFNIYTPRHWVDVTYRGVQLHLQAAYSMCGRLFCTSGKCWLVDFLMVGCSALAGG
jgi:hypothetical protein